MTNEPVFLGPASLLLFVPDLEAACRFYGDLLGLPLHSRTERRISFAVGALRLDAYRVDKPGNIGDYANEARSVFVFQVADIDTAFASLSARGVRFLHRAPVHGDLSRYAAFADPFGNVHELAERTE